MDSIVEIPEEKFGKILEINLSGVYRVNKTFLPPAGRRRADIVTTSEVANLKPYPFNGMYCHDQDRSGVLCRYTAPRAAANRHQGNKHKTWAVQNRHA